MLKTLKAGQRGRCRIAAAVDRQGATIVKLEEQKLLDDTVPDMIDEWIKEMAKIGKEAEAKAYAATVRKELGL